MAYSELFCRIFRKMLLELNILVALYALSAFLKLARALHYTQVPRDCSHAAATLQYIASQFHMSLYRANQYDGMLSFITVAPGCRRFLESALQERASSIAVGQRCCVAH